MIRRLSEHRCAGRVHPSLFASHSLSRGHFLLERLSAQSPQMVMSGLHGVKPSVRERSADFPAFARRTFSILVTFDIPESFRIPAYPRPFVENDIWCCRSSSRKTALEISWITWLSDSGVPPCVTTPSR